MQGENAVGNGVQNSLHQHAAVARGLLLRIFLGHVAEHQHRANHLLVARPDRGTAVGNVVLTAIPRQQHGMVGQRLHRTMQQGGHHRYDHRLAAAFVDDMQDVFNRLTTCRLLVPARKPFCQRVEAGDAGLGIGGNHAITNRVQGHGQLLLADLQSLVAVLQLLVQALLLLQQIAGFLQHLLIQTLQALAVNQVGKTQRRQQAQRAGSHDHAQQGAQAGLVLGFALG